MIGEYCDEDRSGKSIAQRPGLEKATAHACRAKAVLTVYSLSRLARNTKDAIEVSERLERSRADLASLHERIDTSTSTGRFFFTIMAAVAQLEREQIVERTSDAMRRHQKAGWRMGRRDKSPFGRRLAAGNPDGLKPDEAEQATIARIVALSKAGETARGICRILDREGITRRGKPWTGGHALVSIILRREGIE